MDLFKCVRTNAWLALVLSCSSGSCSSSEANPTAGAGGTADSKAAFEQFLQQAPAAFCGWLERCGELKDSVEECTKELSEKMLSGLNCTAAQALYDADRSAADACLAGDATCAKDEFGLFCPPFGQVDLDHLCDPSQPDSGTVPLETAQSAVGAWHGSKTCDSTSIELGFFVCPKGRLRGYEKLGGYNFVDCGTWSVAGTRLTLKYTATATADPTEKNSTSLEFLYSPSADTLTWDSTKCPLVLQRLKGEIEESDCTSSSCTAGGSGSITGCNVDCDCGRCWYCEKGTCRAGGEGPYGCYRGCGL